MPQHNGQDLNDLENVFDHFKVETTQDGSPTLRIKQNSSASNVETESMHHSAGAAAETFYVYQAPFALALKYSDTKNMNVAVIGLGLGYIEFAIIKTVIEHVETNKYVNIVSYEKIKELQTKLQNWIRGQHVNQVYERVLYYINSQPTAKHNELTKNALKDALDLKSKTHWQMYGEINETTEALIEPAQFVAFDAFSSVTDNPLWSESFLDQFIKKNCAEDCVFTTYAATGNLKKALINNGFLILKRRGFSGKRESTLAIRGSFKTQTQFFQSDLNIL